MVVWVFAGGGESEVGKLSKGNSRDEKGGLIRFLTDHFPDCIFERWTPVKKRKVPYERWQEMTKEEQEKAKQKEKEDSYGKTGKALINQIQRELTRALKKDPNQCDLILVFDDLDCRDAEAQRIKFLTAVNKILDKFELKNKIPVFVAFAAPELESWLIADWDNTIAKHTDFRKNKRHEAMRYWLSSQCNVPFNQPESFSQYDPNKDACHEKLSDVLIESTKRSDPSNIDQRGFSKKEHTPSLLLKLNTKIVKQKCPLFQEFYDYLEEFCPSSRKK